MEKNRRQALLAWLFVAALVAFSAALGILQYRWIGEVSRAERERLRSSLQTSLNRLSQDFNAEVSAACLSLLPARGGPGEPPIDLDDLARYAQSRESSRHSRLFRSISIAVPEGDAVRLRTLDPEKMIFRPADWPPAWNAVRDRLAARLTTENSPGRRGPPGLIAEDYPDLLDVPYFNRGPMGGGPPQPLGWLILELDLDYVRGTLIPELLQRHLGGEGALDYQVEIVMRNNPATVIYHSEAAGSPRIEASADASVSLLEPRLERFFRRPAPFRGGGPPEPAAAPPGGERMRLARGEFPGFDRGRWRLFARHRAGSLEAVVAQARARNLAVTTGLLILLLAAAAALVRFTRRAQHLAELQMEFVAGVSHELRTPLSVMRTAGHNLRGKVATDPARVERYGALIQEESEKLTAIVEQVLRFANIGAGRVIGRKEPVLVENLIEQAIDADRRLLEESRCALEKKIAPGLPPVLGDPTTLKHALRNLLSNAAKYGKGGDWIGIAASLGSEERAVEIRIADRGAGIPSNEIGQIFDPFYRGKKAVADQIHGTGLGLSLTRRIIEAHHGTIAVRSEPGKGTEFVVRIPVAPVKEDEFANTVD